MHPEKVGKMSWRTIGNMFFCGDVAISGRYDNLACQFDFADRQQALFLNLEGAICTQQASLELVRQRKVFNIDKVIELLKLNHTTGCILANNHITDFDDCGMTCKLLSESGIKSTGYGLDKKEAGQPLYFIENGIEYSLLAFGWNVIGCKYARNTKRGINPMRQETVVSQIKQEREKGKKVIAVFHWNYVYELFPMPANRELAKMAVDMGASLIIGCHSHCIQGIEFYKGVPIVYGLGNWMFDNGIFFDGRLRTDKLGLDELVVEYRDGKLYCHWYKFDMDKSVPVPVNSELSQDSALIKTMTPYEDMGDMEYALWFKKNRRIHKFLPVFISNKYKVRNYFYYLYIICRERSTRKIRDKTRCIIKKLRI